MIYEYDGQRYTVSALRLADGRYAVTLDERQLVVEAQPGQDGCWLLRIDHEQFRGWAASQGSRRFVHVNGESFLFTVPASRSPRPAAPSGGDLAAQMPGQVVDVLVQEGDPVKHGQTLVILEAMKMELRTTAPRDGVVARLLVRKGQVVERGQKLLEFVE